MLTVPKNKYTQLIDGLLLTRHFIHCCLGRLAQRQTKCTVSTKSDSNAPEDETIVNTLSRRAVKDFISIKGWVRSIQHHKDVTFLHVTDGSTPNHLQVVVPQSLPTPEKLTFGSCIQAEGSLVKSQGKNQTVELFSSKLDIIGTCDPFEFPLKQRTRHSPQYTRDFLHVRPKTNIFGSLLRIRNAASMAVHQYFQQEQFTFIHTPILTSSDCEGACEVFKVEPLKSDILAGSESECDTGDDHLVSGSGADVEKRNEHNDFFHTPAYLTVSGQLHLEVITGALTRVYSFGPTFRAENSRGSFHLSEFYMVEAELAFTKHLEDIIQVMERLVKYAYQSVMDKCSEDVALFSKFVAPPTFAKQVEKMMQSEFKRISYTEAIKILKKSKENFKYDVKWGCDLKKEHEMYITKHLGNTAVFVTDYPADIKAFYARRNEDSRTVAACDMLIPGVGELCGSSLREERHSVLKEVMLQQGLVDQMPWYLELRQFGSCPHGGFGLGFERLLLAILGASSLKDVIPFPRWPGNCRL